MRVASPERVAAVSGVPMRTLSDLVGLLAAAGARPAVVQLRRPSRERSGSEIWSGEALAAVATALARGLGDAGVAPGERVLLWGPSSPRWIIACLALLRLGAVPVPVDSQADAADLAHIVADSGARWVFTASHLTRRLSDALGERPPGLILLDDPPEEADTAGESESGATGYEPPRTLRALAGELDPAHVGTPEPWTGVEVSDAEAEAVLFYTSGTSGPPKGVPLSHRNILSNLGMVMAEQVVSPADRMLLPLPLHHVYPFTVGLLAAVTLEVPLVLPQALTGPQLARAIDEGEVTVILGIPRLYQALLGAVERRAAAAGRGGRWVFDGLLALSAAVRRHTGILIGKPLFAPLRHRFAPRLRLLISGGAALDPDLGVRLEGLGWEVAVGYGLTETSPILTIVRPGERRFDSAGRAPEGVELRIGRRQGDGGEVEARGPNVFSGYLHLPEKTAAVLSADGWFRTGDLGRLDDAGWLILTGRASSRIVLSGGENVDPERVEARLDAEPAIAESGILEQSGALAALVVPDPAGTRGHSDDEIQRQVRAAIDAALDGMPGWYHPQHLTIDRQPLPRTRLGKLRRHLLRERFEVLQRGGPPQREPGLAPLDTLAPEDRTLIDDPRAERVWHWLSERFTGQRITPDTDLRLDLGVDSLEWVALGIELEQALGLTLDEAAIGRIATVRELLRAAGEAEEGSAGGEDLEARLARPEAMLDAGQRRWLEPPGGALRWLGDGLHWLARLVVRWYFRLDAAGLEHLPAEGPCLIAPNHQSALDPILILGVLSPPRRRDTYWGGWTGLLFERASARLLSRAFRVLPVSPEQGPVTSLAFGAAALARGGMLVWFPEGQRSADGTLLPFRAGIGRLARVAQVPMVPVYLENTGAALPRGSLWPRRRPLALRVGPAAGPQELEREGSGDDPAERIASALRARVAALRPDAG